MIAIVLRDYNAAFLCHCWFLFFYDMAVDMQIWALLTRSRFGVVSLILRWPLRLVGLLFVCWIYIVIISCNHMFWNTYTHAIIANADEFHTKRFGYNLCTCNKITFLWKWCARWRYAKVYFVFSPGYHMITSNMNPILSGYLHVCLWRS